jgi:hypothetical protein
VINVDIAFNRDDNIELPQSLKANYFSAAAEISRHLQKTPQRQEVQVAVQRALGVVGEQLYSNQEVAEAELEKTIKYESSFNTTCFAIAYPCSVREASEEAAGLTSFAEHLGLVSSRARELVHCFHRSIEATAYSVSC